MRTVVSSVALGGMLVLAVACSATVEGGGGGMPASSTSGAGGGGSSMTGGMVTSTASSVASTGTGGGTVGSCTPAPLMGFVWAGTELQVVRVDPGTGQVVAVAVVPDAHGGFDNGFVAYDHDTKRLYEFNGPYAFTFDASTGTSLSTVMVENFSSMAFIDNPTINGAGQIVVMLSTGTNTWNTGLLDPTTGGITVLAPVPTTTNLGQAQCAVDLAANRLYQLGDSWVLTIDAATGATLSSVMAAKALTNPIVNKAGELIGISLQDHAVARMDPATGAVTLLAPFSASTGEDMRTYDPCENHFYTFDGAALYTLDGTTGATISTVTCSSPVLNAQAIW